MGTPSIITHGKTPSNATPIPPSASNTNPAIPRRPYPTLRGPRIGRITRKRQGPEIGFLCTGSDESGWYDSEYESQDIGYDR